MKLLAAGLATAVLGHRIPLIHRSKLSSSTSSGSVPLSGGLIVDGEYFAEVTLGSSTADPQTFTLQVDTGSSDLLVFAQGCHDCGNHPLYNPDKSDKFSPIDCQNDNYWCRTVPYNPQNPNADPPFLCFDYEDTNSCGYLDQYGDTSYAEGIVATDMLRLEPAGLSAIVSFGMITNASTSPVFEPPHVDGIWGMAYQSCSEFLAPTVFDNLVSQSNVGNWFSLCLHPTQGEMTLGMPYVESDYLWTAVTKELYYGVSVVDMSVNQKSLGFQPSVFAGGIVDSGTTLIIVPNQVATGVGSALQAAAPINPKDLAALINGDAVKLSQSQIDEFPEISFSFADNSNPGESFQWTITGSDYIWCPTPTADGCYLGIVGGGQLILGDVFMQTSKIIFDKKNRRVGFGKPDCHFTDVDADTILLEM